MLSGKVEVSPQAAKSSGIPYTTVVHTPEGEAFAALKAEMEKNSRLIQFAAQGPDNLAGLERRALEDVNTAKRVMQSQGYYEGVATWHMDETATPVAITLNLEPGPLFTIGAVRVDWQPTPEILEGWPEEKLFQTDLGEFGLDSGQPALAANVLAAVGKVTDGPHKQGFPFAKITSARYVKDREKLTVDVLLVASPGPPAVMGAVQLTEESAKNTKVSAAYVEKLAPWKKGIPWNENLLRQYADILRETGLFSTVEVAPGQAGQDVAAPLPIMVTVHDALPRTVSAGLSYSTDTAFGGRAAWEHRNFLGHGEKLKAGLLLSQDKQELSANFRKPQFWRKDQALIGEAALGTEKTDAWNRQYVSATAGLERKLNDLWRAALKGTLENGSIDEGKKGEGWRGYQMLGVTLSLWRDSTDDPLNPSRGSKLEMSVGPYSGFYRSPFSTVVARWTGSLYYSPWEKLTLAGRMSLGSMFGASRQGVPGSLRFYAGGGGSVRGYTYQSLGPHNSRGEPAGGQSVQELSLEARIKVTDTFGIVPFLDGGMAYAGSLPRLGTGMDWAAGLGFRYYTGIGPIRLDVATPLKNEKKRTWQMYFSIGQAF